jgi:hypothetical protein
MATVKKDVPYSSHANQATQIEFVMHRDRLLRRQREKNSKSPRIKQVISIVVLLKYWVVAAVNQFVDVFDRFIVYSSVNCLYLRRHSSFAGYS